MENQRELVSRLVSAVEVLLTENLAYAIVLQYPADRQALRENFRVLLREPRSFVGVRQEFQAIHGHLRASTAPSEILQELVTTLESPRDQKTGERA